MKKYIITALVLLLTFNCLWAVKAKVKVDGLTGESSVETSRFKFVSASGSDKRSPFVGIPEVYAKFVYKDDKTYLVLEYLPSYKKYLLSMLALNLAQSTKYQIFKGDILQIRIGEEVFEFTADNDASTVTGATHLSEVYYDVSDIDFSKYLVSYIRAQIKYNDADGEIGGEVKASGAKKLQKAYSNLLKAIEKTKK